jgi:hypothetical protein
MSHAKEKRRRRGRRQQSPLVKSPEAAGPPKISSQGPSCQLILDSKHVPHLGWDCLVARCLLWSPYHPTENWVTQTEDCHHDPSNDLPRSNPGIVQTQPWYPAAQLRYVVPPVGVDWDAPMRCWWDSGPWAFYADLPWRDSWESGSNLGMSAALWRETVLTSGFLFFQIYDDRKLTTLGNTGFCRSFPLQIFLNLWRETRCPSVAGRRASRHVSAQ